MLHYPFRFVIHLTFCFFVFYKKVHWWEKVWNLTFSNLFMALRVYEDMFLHGKMKRKRSMWIQSLGLQALACLCSLFKMFHNPVCSYFLHHQYVNLLEPLVQPLWTKTGTVYLFFKMLLNKWNSRNTISYLVFLLTNVPYFCSHLISLIIVHLQGWPLLIAHSLQGSNQQPN